MITMKQKENVWTLFEIDKLSKTEIARRIGISRHKVIEILKDSSYKNAQFIDEVKKINEKNNESLIKLLEKDNRMHSIASRILNLFDDEEQLTKEIDKNGLRSLATVFGVISDKALKAKELVIKEDKAEQDKILNTTEIMNDNFETAILNSLKEFRSKDIDVLIEKDSLDVPIIQ